LRNFLGEIPAKYIEVVPEEPKEASQTQKLFSLQASAKSPALTPELLLLLLGLVLVENVLSRRDSSRSFL
jgi:hypothetical protein